MKWSRTSEAKSSASTAARLCRRHTWRTAASITGRFARKSASSFTCVLRGWEEERGLFMIASGLTRETGALCEIPPSPPPASPSSNVVQRGRELAGRPVAVRRMLQQAAQNDVTQFRGHVLAERHRRIAKDSGRELVASTSPERAAPGQHFVEQH